MMRVIKGLRMGLMAGVLGLVPAIASAESHDFDRHHDRDDHRDVRVDFGFGATRVVEPGRVWVEPVYRTVCDQVWVAPVVQDVCDRVWIAPVYEPRQVVRFNGWNRQISYEQVLVSPGHYEDHHRQVVVTPGHWDNVERQEIVSPGHWEVCATPAPVDHSFFSFGFGFRGH